MRILCCGDRDWTDEAFIHSKLVDLPKNTTLIHGDCRGADRIAGKIGKALGLKVKPFPTKWHIYGKGAGPIRNEQMINEGLPTHVIAFHDHLDTSKGTKDMIKRAESANIPVTVFTHKE